MNQPTSSNNGAIKGVQKIRTLIEGLDEISHGGLPSGRTTLVSGTSGTGKTLLAIQFLYHGIKHFDYPGLFVTFEESPETLFRTPIVSAGISKVSLMKVSYLS